MFCSELLAGCRLLFVADVVHGRRAGRKDQKRLAEHMRERQSGPEEDAQVR